MSHRVRHVPFAQRRLAPLLARFRGLGPRLARWESAAVMDRIGDLESQTPVWICGMARSGSTILLHMLDALPSFTTHRYSDYPWMWTPYWWNHLYARLPLAPARKQERAHRDAIEVTPQSPEAFEEMFWMHFFYGRHDPAISQVLDGETHNEEFQRFFDQHQRKLLAIRGARRYLAKANYQLARLGYLHRLYPKARFVIPVRNPRAQVDSLIRQDDLFCRLNSEDSAVGAHMARIGHFEFGAQKRVFNMGDDRETQAIAAAFSRGDRIEAYARQWAAQYGYALQRLAHDPALADACLWIEHERLCRNPRTELARLGAHLHLDESDTQRLQEHGADQIHQAPASAFESGTLSSDETAPWTSTVWASAQEWASRPANPHYS